MYDVTGDLEKLKEFFIDMIMKHGFDEDKWREEINSFKANEREMYIAFGPDEKPKAIQLKANFIISNLEVTVDPEIKEELE